MVTSSSILIPFQYVCGYAFSKSLFRSNFIFFPLCSEIRNILSFTFCSEIRNVLILQMESLIHEIVCPFYCPSHPDHIN